MWGSGNDEKAAGIIEVWASTIAVWLFGGTSDQDDVTTQVAEYFSTVIFQTNPEVAFQELSVYQNERALSESTTNFVTVQWIVYLRCLRALGAEIDFADLPRPLSGTMKDDLIQSGIIQPRYVGSFESIMGIMPLILDGLQSAKRDFEKAR
jgi:hypothetical protein